MARVVGLMMVILCWWMVSGAEAACSGSGQSYTCTAGTTPGEINSTLSSASDGATLSFQAGNYTWGGTIIAPSISKGVTFACASAGACTVNWSGTVWTTPSGSSSKLYRWTGFNFVAAAGANSWWWHCTGGKCADTELTQLRVDHNNFTLQGDEQVLLTDTQSITYLYGVIDHNTFNIASMSAVTILYAGALDGSPTSGRMGTAQNLFVEDNIFTITRGVDGGVGCLDGWHVGVGLVWRFNTMTNCRTLMHGVPHNWGPSNFELYGNAYNYNSGAYFPSGYRSIHHQGSGTYAAWGNSFTTSSHDPDTIVILHYRAFQPGIGGICNGTNAQDGNRAPQSAYQGYPCKHQPGRDNNGLLYPMFSFLNRWTDNGAKVDMVLNGGGTSPDYSAFHIKQNRDLFNVVTPFDGTTGMGVGPLANRPASCTTTVEAADAGRGGVLYWATDQGNWNQSSSNPYGVQQNGADGVLYMCSSTNTWTVYYTPYTYPHPLQSGAAPPPSGGAGVPQAPTNLHVVPSQP